MTNTRFKRTANHYYYYHLPVGRMYLCFSDSIHLNLNPVLQAASNLPLWWKDSSLFYLWSQSPSQWLDVVISMLCDFTVYSTSVQLYKTWKETNGGQQKHDFQLLIREVVLTLKKSACSNADINHWFVNCHFEALSFALVVAIFDLTVAIFYFWSRSDHIWMRGWCLP